MILRVCGASVINGFCYRMLNGLIMYVKYVLLVCFQELVLDP